MCISFADSSKAVQILLAIFKFINICLYAVCLHMEIYVKNLTFTLYCGGVFGGGGGAIKALLVWY